MEIFSYYYKGFSRYLSMALFILNICLKPMEADPNLILSVKNFGKDSNFESQIALFGDAVASNGSMLMQVTGSRFSSAGSVICKKPINLIEGKSQQMVSFTNYFVFSMSGENGSGLSFVMLPAGFLSTVFDGGPLGMLKERKIKFLAVEFDTFMDEKYGDVNSNHVGIDVGSIFSVKTGNVSSINLVLNSGEKLQAWIDYEASSKSLEVRLNKYPDNKPTDPFLAYTIDLSKWWKRGNVTVGFTSSSGNSSQKVYLYSWSFASRTMPNWMHSQPLDPEDFRGTGEVEKVAKRSDCHLRILAALVFGSGCGALVALSALFVWTVVGSLRRPEELPGQQSKEYEYKKFNICTDCKAIESGK